MHLAPIHRTLVGCVLASLLALAGQEAAAESVGERIAVVPSRLPEEATEELRVRFHEALLEAVATSEGLDPRERALMEVAGREIARCRDQSCVTQISRHLELDHLLWVEVSKEGDTWRVATHRIDPATGDFLATRRQAVGGEESTLVQTAPELVKRILATRLETPAIEPEAVAKKEEPKPVKKKQKVRLPRPPVAQVAPEPPPRKPVASVKKPPKRPKPKKKRRRPPRRRRPTRQYREDRYYGLDVAKASNDLLWRACDAEHVPACDEMIRRGQRLPFGRGARITGGVLMGVGVALLAMGFYGLQGDDAGIAVFAIIFGVGYGTVTSLTGLVVFTIGMYRGSHNRWGRVRKELLLEAELNRGYPEDYQARMAWLQVRF